MFSFNSPRSNHICSKTTGTVKNTLGKVEETIGGVTGVESWKTSGQERRVQGDAEHKEGQAQGYTEGTKDRLLGKKDQVTGAVTGDTSQETAGTFLTFRSVDFDLQDSDTDDCASYQVTSATRRARPSKTGTSRDLPSPSTRINCFAQCNTPFLVPIHDLHVSSQNLWIVGARRTLLDRTIR